MSKTSKTASLRGVDVRLEAHRDVYATINIFGSNRQEQESRAAGLPVHSPEDLACASAALLSWPHDIEGQEFKRPELALVEEHLKHALSQGSDVRSILLFGQPGSGKSALMALLGEKLAAAGSTVLGIKADMLKPSVDTIKGLGRALELGDDLVSELRSQAAKGPLYILVDQLDAVASLIDGSGGRLYALCQLVRRLRSTPGIGIVVSARRFEFEADAAFRSAFPPGSVHEIELELPSLAEIDAVLLKLGIDPADIPDNLREITRVPQALRDIVLALRSGFPRSAMTSWRQLQAKRFERLLEQSPNLQVDRVIKHLIGRLRVTGSLWTEEASLPLGTDQAVQRLLAEDILRRKGTRYLGFAHQTWAETLDARFSLAEGNLVERIGDAGLNLLARPQALATLRYVRDDAQHAYDDSIEDLWQNHSLQRHLRHLVLDVAASAETPTPAEQRIVAAVVASNDEPLAERALRISAGKRRWFLPLRNAVAGRMASLDDDRAWSVMRWLAAAAPSEGAEVIGLVRRYWYSDRRRSQFVLHPLEHLEQWDEEAFQQFRRALEAARAVQFRHLAVARHHAEKGRHDTAARLLAMIWDRIIATTTEEVQKEHGPSEAAESTEAASLGAAVQMLIEEERRSFSRRFTQNLKELAGLHGFATFMKQSPTTYLDQLVPRIAALDATGVIGDEAQHTSARDWWEWHSLGSQHSNKFDIALIEAIRAALQQLGRINAINFLEFVETWKGRLNLLDRLIVMAFPEGMPSLAEGALTFLETSPECLDCGDRLKDDLAETLLLIGKLSPCLDYAGSDRLVAIIMAWNRHKMDATDDAIERRRIRFRNRSSRVRLLKRLDLSRLSETTYQLVQEELRACPEADAPPTYAMFKVIKSPMSAEAMARAKDTHIIKLFKDLASMPKKELEQRSWSLAGGAREASLAFGEFAKAEPKRALRLLDRLPTTIGRSAVGSALVALADADDIDPKLVLAALDTALAQGFADDKFERDATFTLERLALRLSGLEDVWIERLVSWLRPPKQTPSELLETDRRPSDYGDKELPTTVLLETGRLRVLSASNNYTIMSAVTNGLLCRVPPDYDRWMKFLEARSAVPETDGVWEHFCRDLVYVNNIDPNRATRLLSSIFRSRPIVRDSSNAVMLVAQLLKFLPRAFVDEQLDAWRISSWPMGRIAFGEVSALRAAILGPDYSIFTLLDRSRAGEIDQDILSGIANFAVEYWNDDDVERRTWARTTLSSLAARQEARIASVCAGLVRRVVPWPQEDDMRQILRIFGGNPAALREMSDMTVDSRLMELVDDPSFHDAMMDFIEGLVQANKTDLRDHQTTGPFLAQGLIPIVLTIHRDRASRARTLALFERLLDLVPDAAEEILGKFEH